MKAWLTIVCLLGVVMIGFAQMDTDASAEPEPKLNWSTDYNPAVYPRVAVCDIRKAFDGYDKATALSKQLERDVAKLRQYVQTTTTEIAAKQIVLDGVKKRSDEYIKAFEELATLKATFKVYAKAETAKLNERQKVLAVSGLDDIRAAVAEVAKERKLSLVLSHNRTNTNIIYSDDTLDITPTVIDTLNGGGE